MAKLEDMFEHRARTTLCLFHEGLYKNILVLTPSTAIRDVVFDSFEFLAKHTKIIVNKSNMQFLMPSTVGTKRDGRLLVSHVNFEALRGLEWDLVVEFGEITAGSYESMIALYASVRLGDDPLIIRWALAR